MILFPQLSYENLCPEYSICEAFHHKSQPESDLHFLKATFYERKHIILRNTVSKDLLFQKWLVLAIKDKPTKIEIRIESIVIQKEEQKKYRASLT